MGQPNPSRETKFSGANGDEDFFIFSVQLTTSRIGNLTRLIHTLAICVTIRTYIHDRAIRPCHLSHSMLLALVLITDGY